MQAPKIKSNNEIVDDALSDRTKVLVFRTAADIEFPRETLKLV